MTTSTEATADGGQRGVDPARWRWTAAYYVVLSVWLVIVYQQWFEDLVGVRPSTWFWKANEVYVVALAVPLFWDAVVTKRTSAATVDFVTAGDRPNPMWRHVAWYAVLAILLALFEGPLYETIFGDRVPQRILTLRDVIVGLLAVSLYFDWSRGIWRTFRGERPRMVAAGWRVVALAMVLLVNIAIYQQFVKDLLGFRISNALDFHAEAFAVVFFIIPYFDLILPMTRGDDMRAVGGRADVPRRRTILVLYLAAMAFFAWVGQGQARDWFDSGFGQWFVRSPEPPMSALAIVLYFELLRRLDGVRPAREAAP